MRILGPLEARLTESDRVVLGGLVEGTWPPESNTDAWLSRPMRLELGLDLPERRIGLSAHDFAQLLGAREVILSHAAKIAGAPTVPSRFIQRLAAVAGDALASGRSRAARIISLGRANSTGPSRSQPAPQPAPKPPRAARPKSLSVTEIEDWLRDPYTIYAKHILRLRPLDRGRHRARRRRARHDHPRRHRRIHAELSPTTCRPIRRASCIALGEPHFAALEDFPEARAFWWPRFLRIAHWFARWEVERRGRDRRDRRRDPRRDRHSRSTTAPFKLRGIADRIERERDGRYVILDYKTGAARTEKQVRTGLAPQLTLEAAMLREGGFTDIPAGASVAEIVYVLLKGGEPPGEYKSIEFKDGTPDSQADRALERLSGWPSASTTKPSLIARSSIRCGRTITATTTISRASRNGRAAAARTTTSGAANENAATTSRRRCAQLQRERRRSECLGLGRRQCRLGQDPCAGAARRSTCCSTASSRRKSSASPSPTNPKEPEISAYSWDLAHILATDTWEILEVGRGEHAEELREPLLTHTGTVVLWRRLDRMVGLKHPYGGMLKKRILTMCSELEEQLAMTFHRHLAGEGGRRRVRISVNGKALRPWDPFVRSEKDTVRLEPVALHYDHEGVRGTVLLEPYVLPHQEQFSSPEAHAAATGPLRWNRQQGFYIYRAGRMVQNGGWSNLRTLDEHTKLARVALSFDPRLDEAFRINVAKMRVQIPRQLREQIEQAIAPVIRQAQAVYRRLQNAAAKHHPTVESGAKSPNEASAKTPGIGAVRVVKMDRHHSPERTDGVGSGSSAGIDGLVRELERVATSEERSVLRRVLRRALEARKAGKTEGDFPLTHESPGVTLARRA